MIDIVREARNARGGFDVYDPETGARLGNIYDLLADRLEAQAAEIERLRGLLDAEGLASRIFDELGEPDYKLNRWTPGLEPWEYWCRDSIASAIARAALGKDKP